MPIRQSPYRWNLGLKEPLNVLRVQHLAANRITFVPWHLPAGWH